MMSAYCLTASQAPRHDPLAANPEIGMARKPTSKISKPVRMSPT